MGLSAIKFCKIEFIDLSTAPEVKYTSRELLCVLRLVSAQRPVRAVTQTFFSGKFHDMYSVQ